MGTGKYYWSKVNADWWEKDPIAMHIGHDFGEEKVRIDGFMVKSVYNAMLTMSSATEGYIRVDDDIPYTPKLLANRLGTDVRVVQAAFTELQALGAMVIMEDGTIYLPYEYKMVGSESDSAERVRRHRERKRAARLGNSESANDVANKAEPLQGNAYPLQSNDVTPDAYTEPLPLRDGNTEYRDKNFDEDDNLRGAEANIERCVETFAQCFGRQCNPAQRNYFARKLVIYETEKVIYAIKEAALRGATDPVGYTQSLFNDWDSCGWNTAADVENGMIERELQKNAVSLSRSSFQTNPPRSAAAKNTG